MYPWHEAPEWAQWAACDLDGSCHWFETEPALLMKVFWINGGRSEKFTTATGVTTYNIDGTLESRPEIIDYK